MTANSLTVLSVTCFFYKENQFLGVSGNEDLFEVFDVSMLEENEFLSREYVFLCLLAFFVKAWSLLCKEVSFTKKGSFCSHSTVYF